ncbi:hypothetical protein GLOIN_2v1471919 [Rhizophagus irregularis DAOM 181602=DAOM 197198]|nr:hypothetical protein GLOIN_2v1471919 [Rhizophagus irregularis DAOM 181602=DAOM 197198]
MESGSVLFHFGGSCEIGDGNSTFDFWDSYFYFWVTSRSDKSSIRSYCIGVEILDSRTNTWLLGFRFDGTLDGPNLFKLLRLNTISLMRCCDGLFTTARCCHHLGHKGKEKYIKNSVRYETKFLSVETRKKSSLKSRGKFELFYTSWGFTNFYVILKYYWYF